MADLMKVMRLVALLVFLVFLCTTDAFASQITLKNGDRITGTVTASTNESLTVHSALIGDVQIPWNAVEKVNIQENVSIPAAFRKGARPVPQVPVANLVKKEGAAKPTAPVGLDQILLHNWSGSVDPGFTWTNGNANTRTINIGVNAIRTIGAEKMSFSFNWVHTNNDAGGQTFTTAKAVHSGTRYDHSLNPGMFLFGSGNWEYDRFQQLDLRNVLGSGLGWHAVKRKTFRMDFLSGGNFNRESFQTGLKKTYLEAVTDEEMNYHPNDHLALRGHVMLIPNLTQPGQFRALIEATAITTLNKYVGWQITMTDRYTSLHLPSVKPNDMVVTTGLHVAFKR